MTTNYEIWQAVLAEFELKVSKPNFVTWFRSTGIGQYQNGHVVICVPNAFTQNWLEKKYHLDIVRSLERITGQAIKKVDYVVENIKHITEQELTPRAESTPKESPAQLLAKTVAHQDIRQSQVPAFGLNPKYTFQTFIVGKNNELAHAAARAVAERPGDTYNPLFIYGGVGLGKTHLIQAIGHALTTKNPQTRILYVSSEKFMNDFISAIKAGHTKEFKDRYRTADLLLIDDIQFIGGKEETQEEFFHTFNELHQHGRQVVLTSDRPPKQIPALEDRLRSRLEWGMIADISAADLETRVAILQAKCQEKGLRLGNDVIEIIAATIQSNIRELEGALNKVAAFHQLKNINPTKETVKSILASYESQGMKKSTTPRELIAEVAKFYDVSIDDILGKSREKKLSFPRQIIMYLLRQELKLSYPAIGNELGGRDHTTAMHANSKITREVENDLKLKQEIEMIKQRLYASSIT